MRHLKKFESFIDGLGKYSDEYDHDLRGAKSELISTASEIIGKQLDTKTAYKEIVDFIESNINNKSMEKDIDTLTDIKRKIKDEN